MSAAPVSIRSGFGMASSSAFLVAFPPCSRLNGSFIADPMPGHVIYRIISAERQFERMKKVAVIMGSDSDLPVVEKAIDTLREFGVPMEVHVCSAHRTPDEASRFARTAAAEGFGVLIAAAGLAAHLAGALAANTTLPVIGIPMAGGVGDGLDALLSTVMMPPGVPVATVGVGGAVNAALLAVQILALSDNMLADKLAVYKRAAAEKVKKKDLAIQEKYNLKKV